MSFESKDGSRSATTLSFMLSPNASHSIAIARLLEGGRLLLDGPYGHDPNLNQQENVILVAKGTGILSTMPLALDLAMRRHYDNEVKNDMKDTNEAIMRLKRQSNGSLESQPQPEIEKKLDGLNKTYTSLQTVSLFRDATRKVSLFWLLEENSQLIWANRYLQRLQSFDPAQVSF